MWSILSYASKKFEQTNWNTLFLTTLFPALTFDEATSESRRLRHQIVRQARTLFSLKEASLSATVVKFFLFPYQDAPFLGLEADYVPNI